MRVGSKQKKVDIDVPQLNDFVHKVYVNCARKLYTNVYLFERGIPPLSSQKNAREIEIIIKECILESIRDSIPLEMILKTYMDETIEDHTEIKMKEEIVSQEPVAHDANATNATNATTNDTNANAMNANAIAAGIEPADAFPSVTTASTVIKFNDVDSAIDANNLEHSIHAPKTEERLEQISNERYLQRKLQEEEEDAEPDRVKIGDDVKLDMFDVQSIEEPSKKLNFDAPELDDIEILT
jgi:hypothetical protein